MTPRPTAEALIARLAALGYAGHVVNDEYDRCIHAFSYEGNRGAYGHPTMTLEWVAQRDADGNPLDTGWYTEAGRGR